MAGRLFGVGLGPGDPELVTVKAARLIGAADVVAYHAARHGRSNARAIAASLPAGRADRGAADLPGHHRDHRPPGRLPGRDRRVLRRARPGSPPTSTPAGTWWCWPRATRSSTAPTCTCTSGSPTATRPRSSPGVTSVSAASAVLGPPADGTRRDADRAARHAAAGRAGGPAGRHRLGRGHEAGPHLRRASARRCDGPAAWTTPGTSNAPPPTGSAPAGSPTSTRPPCRTSPWPCCPARPPPPSCAGEHAGSRRGAGLR